MHYSDFTITVSGLQGNEYSVSALCDRSGRVSAGLAQPTPALTSLLERVADLGPADDHNGIARAAGTALFNWAIPRPIESHLRIAWDHAQRDRSGLRLRLSIDAPELAAWPWELLHDPQRDHTFATSPATPLVRFFDQANHFGSLASQHARLPLNLLLVFPQAPGLDLSRERRDIEKAVGALSHVLRMRVLEGVVTRADLADALLMGDYDIVHFSGHGAFLDGRGYASLNNPDGSLDWINAEALSRIAVNHQSIKLVVMNVCSSGRVNDVRAFQGLAPQMVRYGVPAVVAMQYAISDKAALTFAREFYKRLCIGEDAGQVDVAVAYARSMLGLLHAEETGWAAPVLYTHAADGVIYDAGASRRDLSSVLEPGDRAARLRKLVASLRSTAETMEDWTLADPSLLFTLRRTLHEAENAYRMHASDPDPDVRSVAEQGLAIIRQRLDRLEEALAASYVSA